MQQQQTKKINGISYTIGDVNIKNSGEVFYFPEINSWRILTKGTIGWDLDNKKYQLVSEMKDYLQVVNGYNEEANTWEISFTRANISYYSRTKEGYYVVGDTLPDYLWSITNNCYQLNITKEDFGRLGKGSYRTFDSKAYTANPELYEAMTKIRKKHYSSVEVNNEIGYLSSVYSDLTIGAEIETSGGNMPEHLLYKYGLIPVKDGSISGHEYITVPMDSTPESLQLYYDSVQRLKRFTNTNQFCSLHYHIGNVPKDSEFIVALYTLYYSMQQELHQIMLPYKKAARFLAEKSEYKDHCRYLLPLGCTSKKLDVTTKMNNIYNFYNQSKGETYNPARLVKHTMHEHAKWNIQSRYYILNLIPLLFRGGHGTIEFRLMQGTVNEYLAMNWLSICVAFIKFAEKNKTKINQNTYKYNLEDILRDTYEGEVVDNLISFVEEQKSHHESLILKEEIYGNNYHKQELGFNCDNFYYPNYIKQSEDSFYNYITKLKAKIVNSPSSSSANKRPISDISLDHVGIMDRYIGRPEDLISSPEPFEVRLEGTEPRWETQTTIGSRERFIAQVEQELREIATRRR